MATINVTKFIVLVMLTTLTFGIRFSGEHPSKHALHCLHLKLLVKLSFVTHRPP